MVLVHIDGVSKRISVDKESVLWLDWIFGYFSYDLLFQSWENLSDRGKKKWKANICNTKNCPKIKLEILIQANPFFDKNWLIIQMFLRFAFNFVLLLPISNEKATIRCGGCQEDFCCKHSESPSTKID